MNKKHRYDALAYSPALRRMPAKKTASPQRAPSLDALQALPDDALPLGVAEDGFPVLLDLSAPMSGAMLIHGGEARQRQRFLYALAQTIVHTASPKRMQFALISPVLSIWQNLQAVPHNAGAFSVHQSQADDLIMALTHWAYYQRRPAGAQSVFLLVDGLEKVKHLEMETRLNLHWLLQYGPRYDVWPVVSASRQVLTSSQWQNCFSAEIAAAGNDRFRLRNILFRVFTFS